MKIQNISAYNMYTKKGLSNTTANNKNIPSFQKSTPVQNRGINGDRLVLTGKADEYFVIKSNLSNPKIGSKFLLESKLPEYKGLRLLITPDTKIQSDEMYIGIAKKGERTPSFKGRLYGSIRQNGKDIDYKMQEEYIRFWTDGMHSKVNQEYKDTEYAPKIKQDYNFFIPSDGDGTRYRDITALQGWVTKPASYIPAQLNGKNMSLVQNVISNYTRTGKLDKMFDFVRVKPAQGSAYAFLEGLKDGKISTNRPIVFSWGDNFTDVNIAKLMYNHEKSGSGFTITTIPVEKEKTKSLSICKIDSLDNKNIQEFVEKPQDDDYIESCVVPELGENMCLAAVGPYVISPQVLSWIKDKYIKDTESFRNPDKGYDFSSMIITPALQALKNGEIINENGSPLNMKLEVISDSDTWSDLGSQKDFSKAMQDIKRGKYSNLPYEILCTIGKNIDDKGNITFNTTSRKLFDSMVSKLNLDAQNVIAYCNE